MYKYIHKRPLSIYLVYHEFVGEQKAPYPQCLAKKVTVGGMSITRGESNEDPQFHVMTSSIQATRRGRGQGPGEPRNFVFFFLSFWAPTDFR